MIDYAIYVQAHKNSRRVPNKMLAPFGGSNLFQICLEKLNCEELKPHVYVAAHEEEFLGRARDMGFKTIERTWESANSDENAVVDSFYSEIPADYLIQVNASCPFLPRGTIIEFVDTVILEPLPKFGAFAVASKKRWIWGPDNRIVFNPEVISTTQMDPYSEGANALYAFSKSFYIKSGYTQLWPAMSPFLFDVDPLEAFDIDEQWQFDMAQSFYNDHYQHYYHGPEVN